MPNSTDTKGIQCVGGFVKYIAKFLPNISEVMASICNLTKTDLP